MRAVWATQLDIDLGELPRARAAVRQHLWARYGIDVDGTCGDTGAEVEVVELDAGDGNRARVTTVTVEHPDDPTVHICDQVAVGAEGGSGFVWVRRSLVPLTHAITGTVTFTPEAPGLAAAVTSVARVRDGVWPAGATPEPFDRARIEDQVRDPLRRLPVIGTTDGCGVDPTSLAEATAGIAHVVDLARRSSELPAELDVGVGGGVVLWWPGWPDTRVQRWRGEETVDRYGAGAPIVRRVASASALRVGEPPALTRLGAGASLAQLRAMREQPTGELTVDEVLTHWEADLSRLADASREAAAARNEAARLAEENHALLAAWDDTVSAAAAESGPGNDESTGTHRSVVDVLEWAAANLERIDVSPEALRTAADSPYRWPQRLADALSVLDGLAQRWATDELHGGFGVAAPASGLPWRNGVSDTALTQYPEDYTATTPGGDQVLCGPHLRFGAQTGPVGHLRCYMWLDRDARRILIGPTGRHGRDRSNR